MSLLSRPVKKIISYQFLCIQMPNITIATLPGLPLSFLLFILVLEPLFALVHGLICLAWVSNIRSLSFCQVCQSTLLGMANVEIPLTSHIYMTLDQCFQPLATFQFARVEVSSLWCSHQKHKGAPEVTTYCTGSLIPRSVLATLWYAVRLLPHAGAVGIFPLMNYEMMMTSEKLSGTF